MPQSIGDWVSFFRWLFSLYSTAASATSAAQSITISPKANRASDQQTLGAAQGLANERPAPPQNRNLDAAGIEMYAPRTSPKPPDSPPAFATTPPPRLSQGPDPFSTVAPLLLNRTPYPPAKTAALIEDTHAHRANYAASSYVDGTMYYETDRTVYYIVQAGTWVYMQGVMSGTLSPDTKPNDLGAADVGFRFDATDFFHEYVWNGTVWHYAPWDLGSGWMVMGGQPNPSIFWLCNGSVATLSRDDGGTTTFTTPNTVSANPFYQAGTYNSVPLAANTPTWDATAKTDAGTAHSHGAGSLSTGANGSMSSPGTTGPSIQVAADGHTHNVTTGSTATESAHTHTLSAANAKINAPSEANQGLPQRLRVPLYVRI